MNLFNQVERFLFLEDRNYRVEFKDKCRTDLDREWDRFEILSRMG